jgi:HK97 family phage portal protein
MSILDILRGPRNTSVQQRAEPRIRAASPENPSTSLSNPDAWLLDWSGASGAAFGPAVSERTAMTVSAVYRCVELKAGIIAGMPLKIYRDDPKLGRVEVPDHKYANFFGMAPYPGRAMSSFTWRELWSLNTDLWGNHYSVIRYNNAARIVGFEIASPAQTEVVRMGSGPYVGQNIYTVNWPDGTREVIHQDDMLHIPGIGFDGIRGASRIAHFSRNAVSLAKMLEEQTGRSHENAARPSGSLEVAPGVSPDGLKRQQAWFEEKYSGRLNAGKVVVLDTGSKFTPFSITPEDLQTIESRQFQIKEICMFFGVPPVLIGAGDETTWGTGIEKITIGYLIFKLEADLQRVEAELRLKLFADGSHYPMFDRSAIRALDVVNDAAAAQTEINSGVLTINERRKQKHRPAVKGGDEPMVNSTMVSLSRALNPPEPAAAASKPPPKEQAK